MKHLRKRLGSRFDELTNNKSSTQPNALADGGVCEPVVAPESKELAKEVARQVALWAKRAGPHSATGMRVSDEACFSLLGQR